MSSVIQFNKVTKRFGKTVALDNISFEVPSGVVFAMLGDNGAGKTTAIGSMLGAVRPQSGDVRVLGQHPVADAVPLRHRIGYVPEKPSLYEWMTVDETGWFAAGFHKPGFLDRYRESIRGFGIQPGKKIRELSKGMKAKVSLSLAVAHEPELLILDEPTSGLDPMVRRDFLESMIERAATGQTVFLSSHQINEVERVADHVALMRQGHLIHIEALESLKRNTRELQINVTDTGIPSPVAGDNVIAAQRTGRQWQVMVREVTEAQLAEVNTSPYVDRCVTHEPSLEEIFVAYIGTHGKDSGATGGHDEAGQPTTPPDSGNRDEQASEVTS